MSETGHLIADSARQLFTAHCDKQALDSAENGAFPDALWQDLVQHGFHLIASQNSGAALADVYALLKVAGEFAVPLPLAETLLAHRWAQREDDALYSIGALEDGRVVDIPGGRDVTYRLGVSLEHGLFTTNGGDLEHGSNVAGENRDTLVNAELKPVSTTDTSPFCMLALSRAAYSAGALQRVLALSLAYASERRQFGRALSKFQAIQHSLAVMAGEVAAANRATDAAIAALGSDRFTLDVAAAKVRTGEASTLVAEAAHQVHGAMGFAQEHLLHHYTRRLWAYREEYGNETFWQIFLGRHIAAVGAEGLWPFLATRE